MRLSAAFIASLILVFSFSFLGAPAPVVAAECEEAKLAQIQVLLGQLDGASGLREQILRLQIQLLQLQIEECDDAPPTNDDDACLVITHNLALGSTDATTGGDVSRLQRFLGGEVTGYYGLQTTRLVMAWQTSHGITSAGTVGPITRAAMIASCVGGQDEPSEASATIDQQSLRHDEHIDLRITGTARNVSMVRVFIVPYEDFGVSLTDFDGLANQKGKDGVYTAAADVGTNGRWAAEFGSAYFADGTHRVVVFDENTEEYLTRAPLVIDTDEASADEAEDAIEEAEEALEEAQDAYTRATSIGAVSEDARKAKEDIDEAIDELGDAKDAYEEGDYQEAHDSAQAAREWAESALMRLGWIKDDASARIDSASLRTSGKVQLTGTAENIVNDYGNALAVRLAGPANSGGYASVANGKWKWPASPITLPTGSYGVRVTNPGTETLLASGTLVVATSTTPTTTPSCSVSASPSKTTLGQSVVVSWQSTNATHVTGAYGDKEATTGSRVYRPTETSTYTFYAHNGSSKASCSVKVTVTGTATSPATPTTVPTTPSTPTTPATGPYELNTPNPTNLEDPRTRARIEASAYASLVSALQALQAQLDALTKQ